MITTTTTLDESISKHTVGFIRANDTVMLEPKLSPVQNQAQLKLESHQEATLTVPTTEPPGKFTLATLECPTGKSRTR